MGKTFRLTGLGLNGDEDYDYLVLKLGRLASNVQHALSGEEDKTIDKSTQLLSDLFTNLWMPFTELSRGLAELEEGLWRIPR